MEHVSESNESGQRHDIGLTHIALVSGDIDRSIGFYGRYANMVAVHRRRDPDGAEVAWLSDLTRPFVLVLAKGPQREHGLGPFGHLGVGCDSRESVDRLAAQAAAEGCLNKAPVDHGYPAGYLASLNDPDGNKLELSFGQEVGLTVESAQHESGDQ
jgi:catechol 2,3-dioxygenase-like lactoylglutathione lyase family enzyme